MKKPVLWTASIYLDELLVQFPCNVTSTFFTIFRAPLTSLITMMAHLDLHWFYHLPGRQWEKVGDH